jgi:hypothetical protein
MMREEKKLETNPAADPEVPIFYSEVVRTLTQASIPILLGGGFALEFHTRLGRRLKDMDLFICSNDWNRAAAVLNRSGFRTELTFAHWLGKVFYADQFIDVIFSSGNGICEVDSLWFKHSVSGTVFGVPINFCPPEEMIWSKSFVMERERYDGADIAHLLLKCGRHLDWRRLLFRFGDHWRVLFSHIVLFDYIYPSERPCVPQEVRSELLGRMKEEMNSPLTSAKFCQGTLLSRSQYEVDIAKLGYQDARLAPEGKLSIKEALAWTAAADCPDENH